MLNSPGSIAAVCKQVAQLLLRARQVGIEPDCLLQQLARPIYVSGLLQRNGQLVLEARIVWDLIARLAIMRDCLLNFAPRKILVTLRSVRVGFESVFFSLLQILVLLELIICFAVLAQSV